MVEIIKKVNWLGSGIIATAKGEKLPFVRSDILNPQTIKAGERVVFSLRIAKGQMFAWKIVPMPANH